jgi:excisionase family DNA binding protein
VVAQWVAEMTSPPGAPLEPDRPGGEFLLVWLTPELIATLSMALQRHVAELARNGVIARPSVKSLAAQFSDRARVIGVPIEVSAVPVARRLLVTLDEAAESLGVSRSTVERLIRAGSLPAVKVAGATRVRIRDLEQFAS